MVDQCKQTGVLSHVGLVGDHGGHLANQPSNTKYRTIIYLALSLFLAMCRCHIRDPLRTFYSPLFNNPGISLFIRR